MSQSGYTPVQLYRSTTGAAVPLAANLAPGELAINIADTDMALYAENASGTVKRLMNNPAGLKYPTADGTSGQVISTDGSGNLTFSTNTSMTYPGAGIAVSTGSAWDTSKTTPSGTIVGTSDTQTLTNKRIDPRVSSAASITSPLAWNSDSYDLYAATAQAGALTLNADAGTPVNGQVIKFRFKDNGTTRTLTFTGGSSKSFKDLTGRLTVSGSNWTYATSASKTVYFGCIYNSGDSRWDIVAVTQEP